MDKKFTILVADRNPHVRDLLLRELRAEGYLIRIARNARDIMNTAHEKSSIDLIILDLGMPDIDRTFLVGWLQHRSPFIPLIAHSFASDYETYAEVLDTVIYIEKNKDSIEHLKRAISKIVQKRLSAATDSIPDGEESVSLEDQQY